MFQLIAKKTLVITTIQSLIMFFVTLVSVYASKLFKKQIISTYLKCFAAGLILSTLLFDINKHLYLHNSDFLGIFTAGLSFLFLFWIDKLYITSKPCHDGFDSDVSFKKALILVIALSIHSFLEGLGFVSRKTTDEVFFYWVEILAHKLIEGFIVGVSISETNLKKHTKYILAVIYSSLTSIGMIVSVLSVSQESEKDSLILSLFNGLCTGSFFYILFVEMMISEFEHNHLNTADLDDNENYINEKKLRFKKLSFMTLGFISMSFVFKIL
jgi:zinc transporter ZupT